MKPRLPRTLAGRLLASSSLLLIVFLSVTAAALDHAFRDSSQRAMRNLLESRVFGLLAAAEVDPRGGVGMRGSLPAEDFSRPGSGLYGRFLNQNGDQVWASPSLVAGALPGGGPVAPGEASYDRLVDADGTRLARLRFGVAWDLGDGGLQPLTVSVAETLEPYFGELARFRREIGAWFVGLGAALLALQVWLLRFVLKPLGQAEREIAEMEQGRREALSAGYPEELSALTTRLNALVAAERGRAARYRETLDNLAHSLKTPLAVVRGVLGRRHLSGEVDRALSSMDEIVAYQLARAAASGDSRLAARPVAVAPLARATAGALGKVHGDAALRWELDVPETLHYLGNRGDLAEILGNLMENAAKWGEGRARLTASLSPDGLVFRVEDDGPGLPGNLAALLERGARGDTTAPGHGIGLAVVRDLVADLEGRLEPGASADLGGARLEVWLPAGRGRMVAAAG